MGPGMKGGDPKQRQEMMEKRMDMMQMMMEQMMQHDQMMESMPAK
jgi:periplasmic protein CpxP/Spy